MSTGNRNRIWLFAASCLVIVVPSSAQEILVDESFRSDARQSLQAVANDARVIVRDLFDHAPPLELPTQVYFKPDVPMTSLNDWERPTTIRIGINVTESQLNQFAYQLGHELGHVMLNPRRTNGLIETLCMAVAYEVLDQLYTKWESESRIYSPLFKSYREQDERLHLSHFPPAIKAAVEQQNWIVVRDYLEQYSAEMKQLSQAEIESERGRDLQTLAAIALRSEPIPWKDLWNLGEHTSPPPSVVTMLLVGPISSPCDPPLSSMLCRIGQCCISKRPN